MDWTKASHRSAIHSLWQKKLEYHGYSWLTGFSFLFLIDLARLYPVEGSSGSLGAKMLLNIVLHSLRKCQEMAVAYSVLFFDQDFPCWSFLYETYIQPGILVQWTSCFLIIYASLIWQGISCATPWKWNSLVHSTFLSECSIICLKFTKKFSYSSSYTEILSVNMPMIKVIFPQNMLIFTGLWLLFSWRHGQTCRTQLDPG